jgi:hypothetical protein
LVSKFPTKPPKPKTLVLWKNYVGFSLLEP